MEEETFCSEPQKLNLLVVLRGNVSKLRRINCVEFHGTPSTRCSDISVWTRVELPSVGPCIAKKPCSGRDQTQWCQSQSPSILTRAKDTLTTGIYESEVLCWGKKRQNVGNLKSVFQSLQLSVKSLIRALSRTVLITDQSHSTPLPTLRSAVLLTSPLSDSFYLISSSSFTWSCSRFYSAFPLLLDFLLGEVISSLFARHSLLRLPLHLRTHVDTHPPTHTYMHPHVHPPLPLPRTPAGVLSFKLASHISALLNHPCCTPCA